MFVAEMPASIQDTIAEEESDSRAATAGMSIPVELIFLIDIMGDFTNICRASNTGASTMPGKGEDKYPEK